MGGLWIVPSVPPSITFIKAHTTPAPRVRYSPLYRKAHNTRQICMKMKSFSANRCIIIAMCYAAFPDRLFNNTVQLYMCQGVLLHCAEFLPPLAKKVPLKNITVTWST
jgi:hypothetical protein